MKKVINGKLYNTDTAKKMGVWDNGCRVNDVNYCGETLYQKRTGEFFLYGEGGAMTKYARRCGSNNFTGGEEIMPISFDEAKKWVEKNLDGDKYEEIFGEIEEDDSKKVISVSLMTTTHEKLKRMAAEQGISIGEIIDRLVQ